jgi:hypothetical protein
LDRRLLPTHGQEQRLLSLGLAAALLSTASPVRAESALAEDPGRPRSPVQGIQTPPPQPEPAPSGAREAARLSLQRGLEWLAKAAATSDDGALPRAGAEQPAPVAVTALAALAWMAGGSAPDRGPQGRELGLAIDWITAHTDLDPQSETPGYIGLRGDALSRMHGHGFAALALTQAACLSPKSERGARIERALRAAIACIE